MEAPVKDSPAERARAAIIARAEDLYRDVELKSVRAWKERNPGRKAIGYLPTFIPREIVHAAGMLPVGIVGGGEIEVVRGDACFQSYICHLPRSTIELGLNGSFDCLDGVVFPSICDVIRNLSGMWQIMFPGKYVHYFDMPQNFDPAIGGAFYERELRHFAADLAKLGGRPVTDAALRKSVEIFNENRRLLARIYDLRSAEPWRVPASEIFLLMRAGMLLPVEEHTEMLAAYLDAVRAVDRRPLDMARISIRGCFCEQPPLDLVRTLERSGCFIVDDDWMLVLRWIRGDIETDGDPYRNMALAFVQRSAASPSLYVAEAGRKGEQLVADARSSKAEGVIFAAPSFCDPALLDQPMTMAAVKEAKIPCTAFQYAENTGQFQVIREQAGTFADSIRLA